MTGSSRYWFILQGGIARKGYLRRRITVTLSIFNFSTCFLAQIVDNRSGRLSKPFLGPGAIFFWKVMTKTRSGRSESACVHPDLAGDGSPADRRSPAVMYGRRITVLANPSCSIRKSNVYTKRYSNILKCGWTLECSNSNCIFVQTTLPGKKHFFLFIVVYFTVSVGQTFS